MAKSNAVATVQEFALSADIPDFLKKGSQRGAENVGAEDVIIPRIELVQALSPARKKNDPAYIEGAEEGMLFNNVTRDLYGPEVVLVPVYYAKQYLVWKDRKQGGGTNGFRGAFNSKPEAEAAIIGLGEDGLEIVDTAQHFVLVHHDGKWSEAVLSMAKSKMKVSKRWNSLMRLTDTDSFSRAYKLSAVVETNARNEQYYNYGISAMGFVSKDVYERGEKLYEVISKGGVKVNTDFDDSAAGNEEEF
jgi:hypothetical protein